ncbi:MAG: hypothetical protein MK185_14945 [Saccharospirillaceae bacterium]|nr:hypothetical protein [Saccharospirillaceae bacterium]
MKHNIFIAALAGMLSCNAIASTLIPDLPDITAPTDEAVSVSTAPLLTANMLNAVESDSGAATTSFEIIQTDWMIYEPIESVELLGGYYDSENGLTYGGLLYSDLAVNIDLEIDNEKVTTIRVKNNAEVELRNSNGDILGIISGLAAAAEKISLGGDNELIKVKTFNNAIVINWPLYISADNNEIDFVMQAVISDSGAIGIRSSISDISHVLFDQQGGLVGCQMRLNNTLMPAENMKSLPKWKEIYQNNNESEWSLLCSANDSGDAIRIQSLSNTGIEAFDTPIIKRSIVHDEESGSALLSYQLNENETLDPGTQYHLIHRQALNDQSQNTDRAEIFTPWSKPVAFTTALNTDYSTNIRGASDFISGQPKTFEVTVTNNGTDTGTPKLELKVPVNAITLVNGSLADFFSIGTGEKQCSSTSINNNVTTLSCDLSSLAANQDLTTNVTITVNDTVDSVQYRVCDAIACENTAFQNLAINVSSDSDSSAPTSTTTSSSSSSGGAFALLLLATPFLRRRKQA